MDDEGWGACLASSPSWLRWFPQFRIKNEAEQLMPVVEMAPLSVEIEGEEEASAPAVVVSSLLPQLAQVVADGMKGKGDQVQGHQRFGQSLLAMSKVVFHMITLIFQQVKAFIFDFPAGSSGCHECHYIGFVDGQRGDEAKGAVFCRLSATVDSKFNIVDFQGIVATFDRQLLGPAIPINQIRFFA